MKIETGVMLMKAGKAWGITYDDGRSRSYGWMAPEDAPIHNPDSVQRPEDLSYKDDHKINEIRTGKLVHVERRTEVILTNQACSCEAEAADSNAASPTSPPPHQAGR